MDDTSRVPGQVTRIVLLTEIPAPFRNEPFSALAAEQGIDLHVLFLAVADPRRSYRLYPEEMRFAWRVLPGRGVMRGGFWAVANLGVLGALLRLRPDVVVVGGWNQPAFWQAALYAKVLRRPLVTWVESTARDRRRGRGPLELAKRAILAASAAFLVPGRASADYVRSLGIAPSRVVVAPNAVDASIFGEGVAAALPRRDELRRALGLTRFTALYVGRLAPEKGLAALLAAVRELDLDVVLVGSGPLAAELRAAAPANVRLAGQVDRDGLVRWYAAADAFVLPSNSEPWGMVLNEAAAAGLPIVASEAAGAAWDLVDDGVNGYRFPAGDSGALASALARVAGDPGLRAGARVRSRQLASAHSAAAWAGAVAALARQLATGQAATVPPSTRR